MAIKLNMLFVLVALLAASLHSSSAQTTHVVGDALGWLVPPGGSAAYATWASTQTFTVGDILLFNFTTGFHTAAQVSKASFDACDTTSPISTSTTGPARITLATAGEHYFICTFIGHCLSGQKLAINVTAAPSTSPAPPPRPATTPAPAPKASTPKSAPSPAPSSTPKSAPSPAPMTSPAPSPSRVPQTYVVGDSMGWIVPPGGPIAYQTWASNKTFFVGDILVFNFPTGSHTVGSLTSNADYDSCNTSAVSAPITTGPARITLSAAGEHFYICTFTGHCGLGQKLAINVTGTASTPSPSSSPAPPSPDVSAPPSPNSAPSFAGAALPITFLAVALAFFY